MTWVRVPVSFCAREGSGKKDLGPSGPSRALRSIGGASEACNPLAGAKETGEKFQSKNACAKRRQDGCCCPMCFLNRQAIRQASFRQFLPSLYFHFRVHPGFFVRSAHDTAGHNRIIGRAPSPFRGEAKDNARSSAGSLLFGESGVVHPLAGVDEDAERWRARSVGVSCAVWRVAYLAFSLPCG